MKLQNESISHLLELHTLLPTFLQLLETFKIIRSVQILETGVCVSDDAIGGSMDLFPPSHFNRKQSPGAKSGKPNSLNNARLHTGIVLVEEYLILGQMRSFLLQIVVELGLFFSLVYCIIIADFTTFMTKNCRFDYVCLGFFGADWSQGTHCLEWCLVFRVLW